jgi:hypothetical protein
MLSVKPMFNTLNAGFEAGKAVIVARRAFHQFTDHPEDHGVAGFDIADVLPQIGHGIAQIGDARLYLFQVLGVELVIRFDHAISVTHRRLITNFMCIERASGSFPGARGCRSCQACCGNNTPLAPPQNPLRKIAVRLMPGRGRFRFPSQILHLHRAVAELLPAAAYPSASTAHSR